ncbi:hypothetical protein GJW-30_1_02604 [Variibacter gotjawalensis]|uniref:Uncharacterized protein n=1 Tax=Variibacter gotjawalensis TaxID=1333996 RepID=A0A0S3PVW0_9BRAD|nr:hypothetical protein [Variibacter gotjawalensis]NIK45895.1 hypothetical protein [Variibacter gotjawalensis]RZS47815.1 hypothetical protein EV661_0208 [Variibacter gotjawalensis]BAT60069.1 hypothetical protein GJW-30_1_02604 [Variibacter gotjawalensis]
MSGFRRLIGIAKRAAALSVIAICAFTSVAHAIEIKCIEASRYKYLYKIFDDDRAKAAAFFGVTPEQLASPEACRAAVSHSRSSR